MSRTVSSAFRTAAQAQETGEAAILLLTIDHDDLDAPIYVCHNTVNITSRGNTFLACAFEFVLPDETDNQPPQARIRIDNVDKQIVEAVRSLASPPSVTAELVLASTSDTIEASYPDLEFKDVSYDAFVVEASLGYEDFLGEPFPSAKFGPAECPGLFS